jgi:hypothetical protein
VGILNSDDHGPCAERLSSGGAGGYIGAEVQKQLGRLRHRLEGKPSFKEGGMSVPTGRMGRGPAC